MWELWLLLLIPIGLAGAMICDNIYRAKDKPKAVYYHFQEPMTSRWTDKRRAEVRLEKAEWDVDFYEIDAKASALLFLDTDIDTATYVPSNVLKFASQTDPVLFRKLMAHNQRVDIRNGVPLAIVRDYNDY